MPELTRENLAEWQRADGDGNRWFHPADPAGIMTLRDGFTLSELLDKREAPQPVIITYGEFRARWEPAEREALFEARKTVWQIDDYITLASGQDSVNLSGATAADAKALFVSLGILTPDRAETIFALSSNPPT